VDTEARRRAGRMGQLELRAELFYFKKQNQTLQALPLFKLPFTDELASVPPCFRGFFIPRHAV